MNPARLSPLPLSLGPLLFFFSVSSPFFLLRSFCREPFSIPSSVPLPFFLSAPLRLFFIFYTLLSRALFFTVSHSRPSLLSSLVLFHTLSPPHKVAFLSLISLIPRSFLLLLSCAFEIPVSSLALSPFRRLSPSHRQTHTHARTHAHSVIPLLSKN